MDHETIKRLYLETCAAMDAAAPWAAITAPRLNATVELVGAACRVCGCTDDEPCLTSGGPCQWVAPDLCSVCYERFGLEQPQLILEGD